MTFTSTQKPKRLWIRLGSFGDLVLAREGFKNIVETTRVQSEYENHWVVKTQWAFLLKDLKGLHRVHLFDPKTGLAGWLRLSRNLVKENFSSVFDLHNSLRSKILKCLLIFQSPHLIFATQTVSKQRLRLFGFYIFKKWWPMPLRPTPWRIRHQSLVQNGFEKLASGPNIGSRQSKGSWRQANEQRLTPEYSSPVIGFMPSSHWPGKEWPLEKWKSLLQKLRIRFPKACFIVFGTGNERASRDLFDWASQIGSDVQGQWNVIRETPKTLNELIQGVDVMVSVDTGVSHLSESLGVPVVVLFGPTHPDMGFGPSLLQSKSLGSDLWCRPCSKDGNKCFRVKQKYKCMDLIEPLEVFKGVEEILFVQARSFQ